MSQMNNTIRVRRITRNSDGTIEVRDMSIPIKTWERVKDEKAFKGSEWEIITPVVPVIKTIELKPKEKIESLENIDPKEVSDYSLEELREMAKSQGIEKYYLMKEEKLKEKLGL